MNRIIKRIEIVPDFFRTNGFVFFLRELYNHQEQQKGQGTKQQSQREGESKTVTKGGSRKRIPLNEGEVGVRKGLFGGCLPASSLLGVLRRSSSKFYPRVVNKKRHAPSPSVDLKV